MAQRTDRETDAEAVLPLRDLIERTGVLAAARLADHPLVRPAAAVGLWTQARVTRVTTAATTVVWHACGVPTWRDLNLLREHLALLRHQVAMLDGEAAEAEEAEERG